MDPFPLELWIQIIRKLDKRDMISLSTTCRTFSTIFHPIIFEEINKHIDPMGANDSRMLGLRSPLGVDKLPLAHLVRSLNLHAIKNRGMSHRCLKRRHLTELASFSTLQHLTLHDLRLNLYCAVAIRDLPHLESLNLQECSTDSALKSLPQWTSGKCLLKLGITYPLSIAGWGAFVPPALQTLTIQDGNVSTDRVDSIWLSTLSNIMPCGKNDSLTKLEWDYPHIPVELMRLLEVSAQLQFFSLSVSRTFPPSALTTIMGLSAEAIPRLEHFAGPAEFAGTFIKGRPVHSVHLRTDEAPINVLGALRLPSVPLTTMNINPPYHLYAELAPEVELMLQHAPATVRHFKWGGNRIKEVRYDVPHRVTFFNSGVSLYYHQEPLRRLATSLSQMTLLRVFEFRLYSSYFDILPHETVNILSGTFPSLDEVIFAIPDYYTRFIRRSCDPDNIWEVYHSV